MADPITQTRAPKSRTYMYAFLITALIFVIAFYVSTYFNSQRIQDIRSAQDNISTDILSLETQFDLLQQQSCDSVSENTILPSELTSLGNQLSYMEAQNSSTNKDEITRLKRLYSLLQIKDYLLMKQLALKCNLKPVFVQYFYTNIGICADCEKQGYVLTKLAQTYPQLRIYTYDYNLDVSALKTLISVNNVDNKLPALVIDGKVYYGFQSEEDLLNEIPQLATLEKATSSVATSTKK
jgi:regulator of replication initiation timing